MKKETYYQIKDPFTGSINYPIVPCFTSSVLINLMKHHYFLAAAPTEANIIYSITALTALEF